MEELNKKRKEIREVIDLYTDDTCLYPDKDCELRGKDQVGRYCISNEGSYKCLMQRLGRLGCVLWDSDLDCRVPLIEE